MPPMSKTYRSGVPLFSSSKAMSRRKRCLPLSRFERNFSISSYSCSVVVSMHANSSTYSQIRMVPPYHPVNLLFGALGVIAQLSGFEAGQNQVDFHVDRLRDV